MTDILVHAGEISAEVMRRISVSRIEATLNAPAEERDATEAAAVDAWADGGAGHWDDDTLTLSDLRGRATRSQARRRRRWKLTRPDGQDPDRFYARVAFAYAEAARATKAPAIALSEEADVPVTTVHRWVREARRRGKLPAARKGRAG